jgi:hypothetical protein
VDLWVAALSISHVTLERHEDWSAETALLKTGYWLFAYLAVCLFGCLAVWLLLSLGSSTIGWLMSKMT